MRCLDCHYDLSRQTGHLEGGHRCPECGRAFDPDHPLTFESDLVRRRARHRWLFILFGSPLIIYFCLVSLPPIEALILTAVVWAFLILLNGSITQWRWP